jgi:hypothetical protein
MKRLPLRLLVLALFLAGAASLSGQEQVKDSEYYPLKVGTTWTYRAGDKQITAKVAKHEKIGDTMCARIETSFGGKVLATEHVSVGKDGLLRHTALDQPAEPPVRFFPLPFKKGDTWKIESKVAGQTVKATFVTDEVEVTVPAGKFQAAMVRTDDFSVGEQKLGMTNWYAKGVGVVKTVTKVGGKDIAVELEKYEPAK